MNICIFLHILWLENIVLIILIVYFKFGKILLKKRELLHFEFSKLSPLTIFFHLTVFFFLYLKFQINFNIRIEKTILSISNVRKSFYFKIKNLRVMRLYISRFFLYFMFFTIIFTVISEYLLKYE